MPEARSGGLVGVRLTGRDLQRLVSALKTTVLNALKAPPETEPSGSRQAEVAGQRQIYGLVEAAMHVVLAGLETEARVCSPRRRHSEGRVELRVLIVGAAGTGIPVDQDARSVIGGPGEILIAVATAPPA